MTFRSRRARRSPRSWLALVWLAGCAPAPVPPDVLLVTLDTLRADALGVYGGPPTPTIDRLAAAGWAFDAATSPLPETRPAHFTILTSRYPQEHGVVSNAVAYRGEGPLLPEVFAAAGYRTAGFVGCSLLDRDSGAAAGFDHFAPAAEAQVPAEVVVGEALDWLAAADARRPAFLWLHLFDPHMPYLPPPPFAGEAPGEGLGRFTWDDVFAQAEAHDGDLPAPVLARALALYAGEVAYLDAQLARLVAALERRGRWDDTVVAVVADHGECFGNGVWFEHSSCLGQGALHVPLVLRAPARLPPGHRVGAAVELTDLAPTLLELAGLQRPAAFAGRGLLPRAAAADDFPAFFQHPIYPASEIANRREVVSRLRSVGGEPTRPVLGDRLQAGARDARWKYVRTGRQEELYDLWADPDETRNAAAEAPEELRRLRDAVRRWLRDHPLPESEALEMDPGLRRSLEALGYL